MHPQTKVQDSLAAIAAAVNDSGLDDFDAARIQAIADGAAGHGLALTVDAGGGLHDPSGARVGAIRRGPSGEWIIDGQNPEAARADAEIPAASHEEREPPADDQKQR